jgi:hypothetical protein
VKKKFDAGLAEEISEVKVELPEEEAAGETNLADLLRRSLQGTAVRAPRKNTTRRAPPVGRKTASTRSRAAKSVH